MRLAPLWHCPPGCPECTRGEQHGLQHEHRSPLLRAMASLSRGRWDLWKLNYGGNSRGSHEGFPERTSGFDLGAEGLASCLDQAIVSCMCLFGMNLPRVISEPGRGLWDDSHDYVLISKRQARQQKWTQSRKAIFGQEEFSTDLIFGRPFSSSKRRRSRTLSAYPLIAVAVVLVVAQFLLRRTYIY